VATGGEGKEAATGEVVRVVGSEEVAMVEEVKAVAAEMARAAAVMAAAMAAVAAARKRTHESLF
jgi:hypothetical protein